MTMSEALASMNGNLASQQDEIEELKQQLRVSTHLPLLTSWVSLHLAIECTHISLNLSISCV